MMLCIPVRLIKLLSQPRLALNCSAGLSCIDGLGFCFWKSSKSSRAFSVIIVSVRVSPVSCFSLIQTRSSFSISSCIFVLCLDSLETPFAGVMPFISSFFFRIVQMVDDARSYCRAKSTTRTPLLCFSIISFFTSIVINFFFLSPLFLALNFFGPMVNSKN